MVDRMPVKASGDDFNRLFPDRRTEGRTNIRRCQLVMARMLKILDHICRSEGISYWLTAGTLIGALRHRGFIPWDWDIDVGMTEEDYRAFAKMAHRLPPDVFFQTATSDPGYEDDFVIAKLRDRYSNYVDWEAKHPEAAWHNGLQVDIILYRKDAEGRLCNPFRGTRYHRDEIFPLSELEYEGAQMFVPKDPDYYIAVRYGDYMTLPPAAERVIRDDYGDPFNSCDHPESAVWTGPRPALPDGGLVSRLRGLLGRQRT